MFSIEWDSTEMMGVLKEVKLGSVSLVLFQSMTTKKKKGSSSLFYLILVNVKLSVQEKEIKLGFKMKK